MRLFPQVKNVFVVVVFDGDVSQPRNLARETMIIEIETSGPVYCIPGYTVVLVQ